jgi:proton-coupled amino acid transporter
MSFVVAYIGFININLNDLAKQYSIGSPDCGIASYMYALACFIVFVPLCYVRKIEIFAKTHIFADILILITLGCCMYFAFAWHGSHDVSGFKPIGDNYLSMVGFSVYAFEGVGLVIPIADTCKNKKDYPKILVMCLLTVTSIYLTFGTVCYYGYQSDLQGIITQNIQNKVV